MAQKKNSKKTATDDLNNQKLMDLDNFSFDSEKAPTTLLEAIENVNATINGMLGVNCLYDPSQLHGNNLDFLAKRLHITPIQAVLFSVCVEEGPTTSPLTTSHPHSACPRPVVWLWRPILTQWSATACCTLRETIAGNCATIFRYV